MELIRALAVAAALAAASPAVFAAGDQPPLADGRLEALGGGPALDAGAFALETNAAALSSLSHVNIAFTHRDYPIEGVQAETAAVGFPTGGFGAAAVAVTTRLWGDVPQYDPQGRLIRTFTYHDDRFAGGYGFPATRWLRFGGAFNYYRHAVAPERTTQDYGVAAGVLLRPLAAWHGLEDNVGALAVGIAADNVVTSRFDAYAGDYTPPHKFAVGAAFGRDIGSHRLVVNLGVPAADPAAVAAGCEFTIAETVALRAAVADAQPAAGVGVNVNIFSFDYTFQNRPLGAFHTISLSVNPGREVGRARARRRHVRNLLGEGRSYYEIGRYDLAAQRFAEVLALDPYNAEARQYHARAKYNQYLTEGGQYMRAGDWERARRAFRAALTVVPDDFLANEYLARVDELEAEEKARAAEEERVAALLAQAEDFKRRGAYKRAISICEEILAAHPDHEAAAKLLAEARRLYAATTTKPVEVKPPAAVPAEVVAKANRGADLLAAGSLNDAIAVLSEVVAAYPTYEEARAKLVEAYVYLGLDYYARGSLNAAIRSWNRGLTYDPNNEKLKRYINKAQTELDQIR